MIRVNAVAADRNFACEIRREDDGSIVFLHPTMKDPRPYDVGLYGDEQHIRRKLQEAPDGKRLVEVLKIFNLGRARFTYTLSVEEAPVGSGVHCPAHVDYDPSSRLPLLPPHSPARDQLSAIYLDYFNNYATIMTYADQHGLTEGQAGILITLARDVHNSKHPES